MKRKFKSNAVIALACFLFLSLLLSIGLFDTINTKLTVGLYGGSTPLSNIVIVSINDKSLQDIGWWPWDRNVFAKLVNKTSEAKIVVIDVAFFKD